VLDDSPRNTFRQVETMQKLGLGVPQVTALAHKLRSHGIKIADDILTVDEFMGDPAITAILQNPTK